MKREMRTLFHATDFQSLMYPNFIISEILGIFTELRLHLLKLINALYGFLWIFILCVICVYELTMLYELNLCKKIKIDILIGLSRRISPIYMNCFWRSSLMPWVRKCVYFRLQIFLRDCHRSHKKLSKLIHAKDIFGFFFHFWLALITFLI